MSGTEKRLTFHADHRYTSTLHSYMLLYTVQVACFRCSHVLLEGTIALC
jgi:hypothetical protein